MSKTQKLLTVEWKGTPWRKLERVVFKLQTRIYKASARGDVKAVRKLQKTLMRSRSAKCLSVRRVTQDNSGKKTAGVDGVKSLSPAARLALVANLKLNSRVKPTRRVWIPKPGSEEKRPLGIPTMNDRALQALVKLALEPEWEARFEPNSYGFRPGRSCHDADDFVILHPDITVIHKCQQVVAEWLKGMGLELKPSKTRITHTLNSCEDEKPGFDFLGFTVRQFPVGKYHSGRCNGKLLGFKTIIKPSKQKLKSHTESLRKVIKNHKAAPQEALIGKINPIIIGWSNYNRTVCSKEIFSGMDKLVYQQLRAWSLFRHPNKNRRWIVNKYWQTVGGDNWVFANRKRGKIMHLIKHSETPIVRHIKVQGERSPYDGDWVYWSTRMGKHPAVGKRKAILLKQQQGKCTHCGRAFKDGDVLEIDHKIPKSQGGKDSYINLQLLHRHCHDKKTADDAVGSKELDVKWLDANPF